MASRTSGTLPTPSKAELAFILVGVSCLAIEARIAAIAGKFILATSLQACALYLVGRGVIALLDQIPNSHTDGWRKVKVISGVATPLLTAFYFTMPMSCTLAASLALAFQIASPYRTGIWAEKTQSLFGQAQSFFRQ